MVSVTLASRYITSASHYHPRYQSRSSMYIHGLIPRNIAELAKQFRLPRMDLLHLFHLINWMGNNIKEMTWLMNMYNLIEDCE